MSSNHQNRDLRDNSGRHKAPDRSADPTLVILDDEPDVAGTMATMAERLGFRAITTSGPEAFFEALRQHGPTHIALDLMMPKVDGVMVLQRLQQEGCTASLIIASGADPRVVDASARTAQEYGLRFAGTLKKPFTARQLASLLSFVDVHHTDPIGGQVATLTGATTNRRIISRDELSAALDSDAIRPYFQPKVSCDDGGLVGFEALARWHDADGGTLAPEDFITLAEQSGQIDRLTERVMSHSISWMARSFAQSSHSIAINVSAYSLTDTHILDLVEQLGDAHEIALDRIVIEVTESGTLGQDTNLLNLLTRMRLRGIRLSIDDFGVGYSSIEQLARLPFSELKIDRRFASSVCHSQEARAIVDAIIGMAKGLNLKTVAEGVEDLKTFSFLQEHGCDVAQGFFIGRPMAPEAAAQWADHDD